MVGQDTGCSPLFCNFCSIIFSFVLVLLREREKIETWMGREDGGEEMIKLIKIYCMKFFS